MNTENLKLKFKNYQKINKNFSQANQDLFVLSCLNGKENGTFLDLGCNDPVQISNTYLLESVFNWTGTAIDIEKKFIDKFKGVRNCKALCQDCTKINYSELLPDVNHIDYLSLDLEPASVTLDCLKQIPLNKIEFSVITFEHDLYRFGSYYKEESRKIFDKYGYYRLCSDVSNDGFIYEDWYINLKYVNLDDVKIMEGEGQDHKKHIFI